MGTIIRRPWTKDDDDRLRALAPTGIGAPQIAKRLGRSHSAVGFRASVLRVSVRQASAKTALAAIEEADTTPAEDDRLRSRWLGLIGPMKARLRAEVEHSATTPRP